MCWKTSQLSNPIWSSNSPRQQQGNQLLISPLNRVKSWNKWRNQTFGLRFDEFMSPKLWLTTTTPKVDHAAHNFLFWLKSPGRSEKDTWRCEPWFVQGRRERTQKAGLQTGWAMILCPAIIDSIRGSHISLIIKGWRQLSPPFQLWWPVGGFKAWLPHTWLGWSRLCHRYSTLCRDGGVHSVKQ